MSMQPSDFGGASRRTREVLRQSEERFRLLVEGVREYAIFMLDPYGYITTWNQGAQRIKGYGSEEIIGEHFSVFYTDEDFKRGHPEEELRIAKAEGSYEEEGLRVRKDGSTFWASVLITALRACLVRVRVKPFWRSLAYAEELSLIALFGRNASKMRKLPSKTVHRVLFSPWRRSGFSSS